MKFNDFIKELCDAALFYVSVPTCVCCKERLLRKDRGLCQKCLDTYRSIKTDFCSICKKPLYECSCTNKFLKAHYVKKLIKIFRYVQRDPLPTNNLIYSLKRDNRRDVLDFLTNELADSIRNSIDSPEEYIFTNVPRRKASIQKYGIDHAELLSKSLAKKLGGEYKKLLISKSRKAQKKTAGEERINNAEFTTIKNSPDLTGKKIIIVDDIVTTGASMGNCATLLRGLGCKNITGAAISVAYKDEIKKPDNSDRFKK